MRNSVRRSPSTHIKAPKSIWRSRKPSPRKLKKKVVPNQKQPQRGFFQKLRVNIEGTNASSQPSASNKPLFLALHQKKELVSINDLGYALNKNPIQKPCYCQTRAATRYTQTLASTCNKRNVSFLYSTLGPAPVSFDLTKSGKPCGRRPLNSKVNLTSGIQAENHYNSSNN